MPSFSNSKHNNYYRAASGEAAVNGGRGEAEEGGLQWRSCLIQLVSRKNECQVARTHQPLGYARDRFTFVSKLVHDEHRVFGADFFESAVERAVQRPVLVEKRFVIGGTPPKEARAPSGRTNLSNNGVCEKGRLQVNHFLLCW